MQSAESCVPCFLCTEQEPQRQHASQKNKPFPLDYGLNTPLQHCLASQAESTLDTEFDLQPAAYSLDCRGGLSSGTVNQKVDPSPSLDMAPMRPPSTDTCLLQMLRPRPVPPLVLGRFMSSSVPCTSTPNSEHSTAQHSTAQQEGQKPSTQSTQHSTFSHTHA